MTKERSKYLAKCSERELAVRAEIKLSKIAIGKIKRCLNNVLSSSFLTSDGIVGTERYWRNLIKNRKLKVVAMKKLLPDIKVRRSDGVLIIEDVMWKNFFKKYFNKCKNEDEILEMNYELCNAVKAAAEARMDKLYKKACR